MQILNKKRVLIISKTLKMQAVNIYLFNCIVKCYQNSLTSLFIKMANIQLHDEYLCNENYLKMIYMNEILPHLLNFHLSRFVVKIQKFRV